VSRLEQVVVGGTAAVLVAQLPGVPGPLRAVIAVAWFLAVPGLAWVRSLPVDGPVEQSAVVVGLSLALDVLVAEALVYLGVAGAVPAVLVLSALTAVGLLVDRRVAVAT
jgi:hypothetical protein